MSQRCSFEVSQSQLEAEKALVRFWPEILKLCNKINISMKWKNVQVSENIFFWNDGEYGNLNLENMAL